MRRRGLTIVEVLIAASVFFLAIAMVWSFFVSGSQQSAKSAESSDAVRSVMIASEFIRYDVSRMRLVDPSKDLAIFNPGTDLGVGRGLSVRVPRDMTADYWYYTWDPVTYQLDPIMGTENMTPRPYQLVRIDSNGRKPLAGCYLADMLVNVVDVGKVSEMQAYLEITLVGLGAPGSKQMYTQAQLLPLTLWAPPVKYEVPNH